MKTPAPLFYGQDEYCRQVIIIEKIQHASTLKELWPGTDDPAEKMKWLHLLFRKLADYHGDTEPGLSRLEGSEAFLNKLAA